MVLENSIWLTVQVRLLSEKLSDQPESHSDKEKMAEFSVPTWMVRINTSFDLDIAHLETIVAACQLTTVSK